MNLGHIDGDFSLSIDQLTGHAVIFGTTGCGKTGLTVDIVEEALLAGVPTLVIDSKGDLTNLALAFPELRADDFAAFDGSFSQTSPEDAADAWRTGIEGEGLLAELGRLSDINRTIFTPGSSAGIPLNVLATFAAPSHEDIELEIDVTLNGLFEMVGIEPDMTSPEFVVCGQILQHAWSQGRSIDLTQLLVQLIDPPFKKSGVMALDDFFPSADRRKLAFTLNQLLSSPTYQSLAAGRAFDPEAILGSSGNPQCAIVSVGHLAMDVRQFVVSRLIAEMTSWMHRQGGSQDLRALVVVDQVADYAPSTSRPPAKDEIERLVKTGRGFGVGVVVACHNPYDLDHAIIENMATWFVGNLRADRDIDHLVEARSMKRSELAAATNDLDNREFLVHTAGHSGALASLRTRHTLCYLAGPLARPQIRELTNRVEAAAEVVAETKPPVLDAPDEETISTSDVIPDLPQRWSWGEWVHRFEGNVESNTYHPALVVSVDLRWDREEIDLDLIENVHDLRFPLDTDATWTANELGGLLLTQPEGAICDQTLIDDACVAECVARTRAQFESVTTRALAYAPGLRMWARPGESHDAFRERCRAGAVQAAAAELRELRSQLDRQTTSALDRLGELTEGEEGTDLDELRLHLMGVVTELRKSTNNMDDIADEVEADWLAISDEIEIRTLTIDVEHDLVVVPWILWIPYGPAAVDLREGEAAGVSA